MRLAFALFLAAASTADHHNGLNFAATQGNSNTGNFLPGVFTYNYDNSNVSAARKFGVTSLRLGFNTDTALSKGEGAAVLAKMRGYVDQIGAGILCMWGKGSASSHGDGRVESVAAAIAAWKVVHAAFNGSNVYYEVFNEPFGYKDASEYLAVMKQIYEGAGLPKDKVILDGTGYADSVAALGKLWDGKMAYHFYPNWQPDGQRTQENYSNRCQGDLKGYSHRTFVTEAGAALDKDNKDYEQYDASGHDGDVNCLRGLDDCLSALHDGGAPVLGVYPWHGYDNGDSYSFFGAKNGNGRAKMQRIQKRS